MRFKESLKPANVRAFLALAGFVFVALCAETCADDPVSFAGIVLGAICLWNAGRSC